MLAGLQALVEASLLQVQEVAGEPRFTMLETIREYGLEQLVGSGEEAAARASHAHHVVELVEEIDTRLWGPAQLESIARLTSEQENIRAAVRWLLDASEFEGVGRLLRRLHPFWWIEGHTAEAWRWAEETLGREAPPAVRARACVVAGTAAQEQGRLEPAAALLREARTLAQATGDRWVEGHSLMAEGSQAPVRGDAEAGLEMARQAHQVLSVSGSDWDVGIALSILSALAAAFGELDEAERYADEYLALARQIGGPSSLARAWDRLAIVALLRQDRDRLAALLGQCISLAQMVGNAQLVAHALMGFASPLPGRNLSAPPAASAPRSGCER